MLSRKTTVNAHCPVKICILLTYKIKLVCINFSKIRLNVEYGVSVGSPDLKICWIA